MQSRIPLLWKLSLLFAVWSSLVLSQPIVLDFLFTVGTVFSVIGGIMFNFLLFQTFLFTGAPAKLFTRGTHCKIYFLVFHMGEINCFMWEAWENSTMHSLYKRYLFFFFLFAVGYSAFYLKLENFLMYFFPPNMFSPFKRNWELKTISKYVACQFSDCQVSCIRHLAMDSFAQ